MVNGWNGYTARARRPAKQLKQIIELEKK